MRPLMGRTALWLLTMAFVVVAGGPVRGDTCSVSATALSFGIYDPLAGTAVDSAGTVSVTCTSAIPPRVDYDILMSPGQSGSYGPRAMTNGTSQLNYNLYTDPARTQVWGDGGGATSVISARYNVTRPGNTETRDFTVYGRAFAGQNVTTGVYLDNITVTVNF